LHLLTGNLSAIEVQIMAGPEHYNGAEIRPILAAIEAVGALALTGYRPRHRNFELAATTEKNSGVCRLGG
jgi:hypothetical protein